MRDAETGDASKRQIWIKGKGILGGRRMADAVCEPFSHLPKVEEDFILNWSTEVQGMLSKFHMFLFYFRQKRKKNERN